MTFPIRCFISFAASFLFSMIIAPLTIKIMKKLKAGQVILGYVEQHSKKEGTPTMGGFIFIVPVAAVALSTGYGKLKLVAVLLMLGYGLLGFLDDFIKIRTHDNLGLKPYQKIIGQLGLAVIAAVFVYKNPVTGSTINLPFSGRTADLSWGIIPFTIFVYLATTNAVNLTDGLDGLAGTVSLIYFVGFFFIALAETAGLSSSGNVMNAGEVSGMAVGVVAFQSREDYDGRHGKSGSRKRGRYGCGFYRKSLFTSDIGHNVRCVLHISNSAGYLF